MKKLLFAAVVAFLLISVFSVAALDIGVTATYGKENPTFGSETQRASNPNADNEDDIDLYITENIEVENTGVGNITIDSIEVVPADGFSTEDLDIQLVNSVTVNAGAKVTVRLKARIPEELDAVDSDLKPSAFNVAEIKFKSSATEVGSFYAWMQRENKLVIKDLDTKYNGETKKGIEDGDEIDGVKPGFSIELTYELKNEYDESDEDVTIEDIEFRVTIDDLDVDPSEDIGDIDAEETEEGTLTFEIEDDVEAGTYDLFVDLEGNDEFGAKHGERFELDFKVERETHDISITNLDLSPASITCDDKLVSLSVDILNIGKRDEEGVAIEVESDNLNYRELIRDITLDESDSYREKFMIKIPDGLEAGSYDIIVRAFYDNDKKTDQENVYLELTEDCAEEVPVVVEASASLDIDEEAVMFEAGEFGIPADVTNTGEQTTTYTVDVIANWAEPVATQTLTLSQGQRSTVYLYVAPKEGETGTKTATISVKVDNKVLATKTIRLTMEEEAKPWLTGAFTGVDSGKVFWIIGDIVLIIVAIFFIKLLFAPRKK
jgi:hypothetical protein